MHRQLGWILVLFVAAITCAAAQGEGPRANSEVLKQFPGYHPLTMAERNPDARGFLLRNFPKSDSSVVHADFDGDGHPDYAVLLKQDRGENAKFVVLLCSDDAECRTVYELDVTANIAEMYLRPVSKGSLVSESEATDSKDSASATKLHTAGIQLNYFEKAAVVYFWSQKTQKIEMIQSED